MNEYWGLQNTSLPFLLQVKSNTVVVPQDKEGRSGVIRNTGNLVFFGIRYEIQVTILSFDDPVKRIEFIGQKNSENSQALRDAYSEIRWRGGIRGVIATDVNTFSRKHEMRRQRTFLTEHRWCLTPSQSMSGSHWRVAVHRGSARHVGSGQDTYRSLREKAAMGS